MKLAISSPANNEVARSRLWLVLVFGFGALLILIAFSGLSTIQRATKSYAGISALLEDEQRTAQILGMLRSDLQTSAIAVRDYLLDPEAGAAGKYRELQQLQNDTALDLTALEPLILPDDLPRFQRMRQQVDEYWHSLAPLLAWTPTQKSEQSLAFLKNEILPRRQAALDLAAEIQALTSEGAKKRRAEIDRREADLPVFIEQILGLTIFLGLLIAAFSVLRILRLERIAARHHQKVVEAEHELRELSHQLVQAQEDERRSLSRELHDQVGQLLTAVRIGIGNIEEQLGICPEPVRFQIEQTRRIAEQALRAIRDLAMGLRPSMLDDLGLGDALQWQARQHSRLCGVPVSVNLEGELNQLSEVQRTCVYRVIQEALNNVAKHARASDIQVEVTSRLGIVSILVRDDGEGFDVSGHMMKGLGIVGMKERVRQLGGQVNIDSRKGHGTALSVVIPLELKEVAG